MSEAGTGKYTQPQLMRLVNDKEFQARYSEDPELNRLFSLEADITDSREEDAQSLGMTLRVCGVDVPPVRVGHLRMLTQIESEFARATSDWSKGFDFQLAQLTEALFVLHFGPQSLANFTEVFRYKKIVATWRQEAANNPALLAAVLDAEQKVAVGLKRWDAAVLRFAAEHVRLEGEETLREAFARFDEWITKAFSGFKLFPQVPAKDTAEKKTTSFGQQSLRLRFVRVLARCVLRLLPKRCGGRSLS
jgi:hypothetical protein